MLSNLRTSAGFVVALAVSTAGLGLTGCNMGSFGTPSAASSTLPAISGSIHGGQQPVSGAVIQLYAANTTASKGASTPLFSTQVTSNASGQFSFPSSYPCPTPNTLVYLTATGGNPGLNGNVNNGALALMAVLGTCSSLTASTFVSVNELTTVAAVEALAPFMADRTHVGSDPGNPTGLAGAFANASSLVNTATGQLQTAASGVTVPAALLNTLADILATCVNTAGAVAGDGSACGNVLTYAAVGAHAGQQSAASAFAPQASTTQVDTITIILTIVQAPNNSVAVLFSVVSAQSPYQPTLSTAPNNWTVPVVISLPVPASTVGNYLMAIDAAQHIWIYTHDYATNPVTGATIFTGTITIYDNNGILLHTIPAGSGGLYFPGQLAADPFGNMFAINENVTLSKFGPNGAALTPSTGLSVPYFPPAPLGGSTQNYPLGISYMESDPNGNLWGIGSGTNSNCFIEVNNSGSEITPGGNFCNSAGNSVTIAAATDGSGNAWFVGNNSVSKVSSTGAIVATGVNSNGCFDFNLATQFSSVNSTLNLAYDRTHNQLWGAADLGIGAIRADGSQVFCDSNGNNLPLVAPYETSVGNTISEGYQLVSSVAVDGGGNLWFTTAGFQEVVILSTGNPVTILSEQIVTTSGLNELDPTGKLITPSNAQTGTAGYQLSGSNVGENLAIDAYGNIWIVSGGNYQLIKIPGLAVPKNYQ